MKYDILTESVPGKAKQNEDCFGIRQFGDDILVALADGISSSDCAKEAADLAVDTILNTFDGNKPVSDALYNSIMEANGRIADICKARCCKMGCAIAIAFLKNGKIFFVSLGNVRIYLHSGESKTCITTDHIYVASNGNRFLTRSISGKDILGKVEIKECTLDCISAITLETDGYYNNDDSDDSTIVTLRSMTQINE